MSENRFQNRHNQTCILLFLYVLLLFIRAPDILIQGRFWAEEGNMFYVNAYNMSPLSALFVVYGGYINLGASGASLIARYLFIPLEYAPYVTTLIGLCFQITPVYLLLTAKDQWLCPLYRRILGVFLILLVPESSEISLQSLHIQFHLTLACTLIAYLNVDAHYQRWFKLSLLFFAPLCGLLPIILVPIFLILLVMEKSRLRLEQFIAIALGSSIQLSFYLYNIYYVIDLNFMIARQHHVSYNEVSSVIFVRDLLFPFMGHRFIPDTKIMMNVFTELKDHKTSILACSVTSFFFVVNIICFYFFPKTRKAIILFVTGILSVCIAIYGVIGDTLQLIHPYYTERYTFLSQALFAVMLLYYSATLPKIGKIITYFLIIWVLLVGSINFFQLFPEAKDGGGHVWRRELQKWRIHPNYRPKIWCSGWYLVVPQQFMPNKPSQKSK